ncbi:MAG: hypothetical protein H7833_07360 [Magnetococcus sp. DMHC-1]|nr:hypothetical protein [Magnetococcales bacterium]
MGRWLKRIAGMLVPYGLGIVLGVIFALLLVPNAMETMTAPFLPSVWEWPPANFFSLRATQAEMLPGSSLLYAGSLPVPLPVSKTPHTPTDHTPALTTEPRKNEEQGIPAEMAPADLPVSPPSGAEDADQESTPLPVIHIPNCGPAPLRVGPATDHYFACKWQAGCLERLQQTYQMIEQGINHCTRSGNGRACRSYYRSLARQYQSNMCDTPP